MTNLEKTESKQAQNGIVIGDKSPKNIPSSAQSMTNKKEKREKILGTEVNLSDLKPNQKVQCGDSKTFYWLITTLDD